MEDAKGIEREHPRWFQPTTLAPLSMAQVKAAKRAFTTRNVPFDSPNFDWSSCTLISGPIRPRSGDLVLARVTRIGHHARIELPDGRKSKMNIGDEIIVTYADRYAPDQFEAEIPKDIGPTNLVASGGIASTVLSRHGATSRPTEIEPIGLLGNYEGIPLNVAQFDLRVVTPTRQRPPTIAVFGTSMNAGKTTTVSAIISGLRESGEIAGATKVTGTGSGADYWSMVDSGAHHVVDFTDAGLASTYKVPFEIVEANAIRLIGHLTNLGCTAIVVEIADGLFQRETKQLVRSAKFLSNIDGVVFAAADAMGAVAGAQMLADLKLPVLGMSGAFTRAPLAMREVAANTNVRVFSKAELASGLVASMLIGRKHHRALSEIELSELAELASLTGPGDLDLRLDQLMSQPYINGIDSAGIANGTNGAANDSAELK